MHLTHDCVLFIGPDCVHLVHELESITELATHCEHGKRAFDRLRHSHHALPAR